MMRAGVCRMDVTPPVGYRLQGHSLRNRPSEKAHDPLFVKVLTVSDGRRRVAVVTADLIGFPAAIVADFKKHIVQTTGIKPHDVLLCASHTHTGPMMSAGSMYVPAENFLPAYIEHLKLKICGGIIEARNGEVPVALRQGHASRNVGMVNRRKKINGVIEMRPNSEGPIDPTVSALRFDRQDGSPLAILFNYCGHATTLSAKIFEISADYPGVAQRRLEEYYPGCTALFTNGCCGDVGPNRMRDGVILEGTFADIERIGGLLAAAVVECAENSQPVAGKGVEGRTMMHKLPFDRSLIPTSEDHLDAVVRRHQRQMPEFKDTAIMVWRERMLRRMRAGEKMSSSLGVPIQMLRVGGVAVVGLPGEVLVGIGLALRERLGDLLFLIGYANDYLGYVPTRQALEEGGYEALGFIWDGYPAPFAPTMEAGLIAAVRRMVKANQR